MDLPEHLATDLREAEKAIEDAQDLMNGVQVSIALWHCKQGQHVFCDYVNPPIGRACLYCRVPEPAAVE